MLGVIKIAVLIMYYRVFPLRGFQIATWVVGGAVVAWTVGFIILCKFSADVAEVCADRMIFRVPSMYANNPSLGSHNTWNVPGSSDHRDCQHYSKDVVGCDHFGNAGLSSLEAANAKGSEDRIDMHLFAWVLVSDTGRLTG